MPIEHSLALTMDGFELGIAAGFDPSGTTMRPMREDGREVEPSANLQALRAARTASSADALVEGIAIEVFCSSPFDKSSYRMPTCVGAEIEG
jgi:hypothetical protein